LIATAALYEPFVVVEENDDTVGAVVSASRVPESENIGY
jgi:hypothetical protein